MAGSAAKNLAMLLATKTYKGINSIGKAVRQVPGKMLNKMENVGKLKQEKSRKMMEDNFGNEERYNNLQK
jgi:hypothetical protein